MIYPKKTSSKKIKVFLRIFAFCVIILSCLLLIINYLTSPNIYWSHFCILGFLYIFLTVRHSMTKTQNISGYVLFQTLLLAIILYYADYKMGYKGWSFSIFIPILIIIANITMFILTIINHKKYAKYAVNQLIIVLLSLSIIYFVYKGYAKYNMLINMSILISSVNFGLSLLLCHRDYKEEIIRKFNI